MKAVLLSALLSAWVVVGAGGAPPVTALPNAHAHNDYEHARPLLDALDQGFCSVEADVWLVDGQLLVAHDRARVKLERTLQALYLDPLRDRVKAHGGRVHPDTPEFFLLIDFKSEAAPTYAALRQTLQAYADMLTSFGPDSTHAQAVTVIVSGNRPREIMAAEAKRWAAVDGRLADLDGPANRHLIPWISDNWVIHFQWRGLGDMPAEEKEKLRRLVAKAHQQGRKVRFWGGPDLRPLWQEQRAAGVDFINTDRLVDLRKFLLEPPASGPHQP